ncbi:MAG: DUF296 domain-containing protein [bacterium]|nr:DUF296 domain-containing protein [bacterium]MDT8366950.1 DUF296 domain-containing protein [bacterium]
MRADHGRIFMGRLPFEGDLLGSLTTVCLNENIQFGWLSVIGAVSSGVLGYYRQDEREYMECFSLEKGLEIVSCTGSVSLRDGEVFLHAHATLADEQGRCYGGHLMPGTRIFAAEYYIIELPGEPLRREFDAETGLAMWPVK